MPVRRPSNHGDNIVSWFSSHTTGFTTSGSAQVDRMHLL